MWKKWQNSSKVCGQDNYIMSINFLVLIVHCHYNEMSPLGVGEWCVHGMSPTFTISCKNVRVQLYKNKSKKEILADHFEIVEAWYFLYFITPDAFRFCT